jgi:hypothetical protein
VPAFGDLDGDTDSDMIIGGIDGKIHYFQNTAAIGSPANFVLTQANFKNSNNRVIDVGDFAIPQIIDVDNDGKNDLVIGSRNGKIAFYKKLNSSGAPQMDSVSHFWGNVNVTLPNQVLGFSYPCVYKNGNTTELIVGSLSGNLRVYNNIDGNINGTFNMADSTLHNIYEGFRTAPTIVDINNDGLLDLFVGNLAGGLSFYKGVTSLIGINDNEISFNWNFELYPNPAADNINVHILNKANGFFQLEIYNALGQLIIREKINNSITLNTEKLKQGIYFCKVIETDTFGKPQSGGLIKKLIIKR